MRTESLLLPGVFGILSIRDGLGLIDQISLLLYALYLLFIRIRVLISANTSDLNQSSGQVLHQKRIIIFFP